MKQMAPAILGVSVAQISLVINTIFASYLQSGSVSWMYYADRLMELPSGVFGCGARYDFAADFVQACSQSEYRAVFRTARLGLRLCMLLTLPAAVGLAVVVVPVGGDAVYVPRIYAV